MKDKRIHLITDTSRGGAPKYGRTRTRVDMNSLLANDARMIKWLMAIQGTLAALKIPNEVDDFRQTPVGNKLLKDLHNKELRKLRAWWEFVRKFIQPLKSTRGGKVAGAAIAMIQQEAERANFTLITKPLTASRAGIDHELFGEIEEFINQHWRQLINN